ncbi:MAG: hypothetical protein CM1200mP35_06120 [Chloroflexota bacterium]|nr:MAG: hypothetical protein CM1200mP35_06120 [Chloroflexota bacterium]
MVTFECSETGVGDLKGPSGVAVDSDGDVYVTDWGNHRVQIYDSMGRTLLHCLEMLKSRQIGLKLI